jgi:UDP-glucose 4-epimerase
MGISKAMGEKVVRARSRTSDGTVLNITRYGNVMASRGSVSPLFVQQARGGEPLTVTDPDMTRFLMSLDEAVDLVLYSFLYGEQGDSFVQKAPASTVLDLAKASIELFASESEIRVIGTRHSEKKHETLLTREEYAIARDLGAYYRIPVDARSLDYDNFISQGTSELDNEYEYSSFNTERLGVAQIVEKLKGIDYIKYQLEGDTQEKGLV